MRLLVLNSKGGVGKSTTSVQVIAPFLYILNGQKEKVNLIEFDDENEDSLTFQNSEIINAKRIKISGNDLDSVLTDITLDNENIIVDVGGNKTTTFFIKSLEDTAMINVFDIVVIPLTDGEQDAINAINTYEKIKSLNNEIKFVFALSRIDINMDLEMQFLDFFGDKKGRIDNRDGLIENINKNDKNIIKLNNSDSIKYSRVFGQTVYELSQKNIDTIHSKMKQALKEKDNEKAKKLSYRITILNKAIQYKDNVLKECFNILNEVIS